MQTHPQLLQQSYYLFLMTHHLHSHSLLNRMTHRVILFIIDLSEILAYSIDFSNTILLDLYNTFTFEESPLFKTHPTVKSFIVKTAKSVSNLVNRLNSINEQSKTRAEIVYGCILLN